MRTGKTACPPREKFEKFFRSESRPSSGRRLVDHTLDCPACRIRFDVLREVSAEIHGRLPEFEGLAAASLDEARALRQGTGLGGGIGLPGNAWSPCRRLKTAGKAGRRFTWSMPGAVVTAILLVIAGTAAFLVVQHRVSENTVRGRADTSLRLIYPRGVVAATPDVLRWSRAAGAELFFIELVDDRLSIILPRMATEADFFKLPAEVAGRLEKGRIYIWSIEAFDDLNRKIATDQVDFQIDAPR